MKWRQDPFDLEVDRINGGWTMRGWMHNQLLFHRSFEIGECYNDQEAVDEAVKLLLIEVRKRLMILIDLKIPVEEGSL